MERSYIPRGMKITGDVSGDGDLQIAGEVNGNVSIEGTLELNGSVKGENIKVGSGELTEGTIQSNIECREHIGIGNGVTVIGNIKAGDAVVNGAVKGDIEVAENLAVGSTAVVEGEVSCKNINVDLGAVCDVNLKRGASDHRAAAFFDEYLRGKAEE